ncbi:MAG: hypothetical protein IJ776_06165 [Paludibacteraceae bacterium]|nr:hypothetical protein [Paludibacteraceae bacterium]
MANEKHIFIGIGGSGCQTIAQIKEKVYEKRFQEATATKSRLQAMNDSYRFLFIDTDQRDIDEANKQNRATFEQGKVPFISAQTDLINLGRANPHAIYYEAKQDPETLINKRILEACSSEVAAKIPDQPLAFGAGAFRMKSRIAFAHALTDFQSKLQAAISGLNDVKTVGGEDCIIYYWVVGSTLGGTGSGIFNDVLYWINQIHHQVVGNGDPQLVVTMYMPKVYIDSNSTEEKYALNAYGVFTELTAFKEMSFEEQQCAVMHRLAFQNDYNLIDSTQRYCPFYYLIPIDIQTDKGTSLGTTRTMYRNTAEMLYHLHNGKAGSTFRSDIDNYMNDIMERNHKDFLVPMGYVSLQKPTEYFNKYMRFRLRRDIMRTWLLCDTGKESKVEDSKIEGLVQDLFRELEPKMPGTVANKLANYQSLREFNESLEMQDSKAEKLDNNLDLDVMTGYLDSFKSAMAVQTGTAETRDSYKKQLIEGIWSQAEKWIRTNGLSYAHDAVDAVRNYMAEKYKEEDKNFKTRMGQLSELEEELQKAFDEASKISLKEKTVGSNKSDISNYLSALEAYKEAYVNYYIDLWAHDLKKDFCTDEKNDELSKLRRHIAAFKDKAAEMNRDAVKLYNKLSSDMGAAALDVTTVYLPQLQKICDGNGWIQDNIFSKFYNTFVHAQQDKEETAERVDLMKFIDDNIYNAVNEAVQEEIAKGQYKIFSVKTDEKTRKEVKTEETRFFCNPLLERSDEKIIEDFVSLAISIFDRKLRESKDVQEKWDNKKISSFFADLTNDEKDSVRRSLNPALFFSYNSNRIEVMKKEEHLVFVAGSEDLAMEMLGFQKGNPKHRFEKADDENTALVLKSKYGLSLEDYRIYDSLKLVYEKAVLREKYHFHHYFAQYQGKLTMDNLPIEILPQHRAFAKMLILDSFKDELKDFFYVDEYDPEVYTTSMYYTDPDCDTYFKIAEPDAFSTDQKTGKLILKTEDNGREMFKEIVGADFIEQFDMYMNIYHNYRFGDTVEAILQAVLRQKGGEEVFKKNYAKKHAELLQELSLKKQNAPKASEQRLLTVLFNIVRKDFDIVQKFIK